MVEANHHRRLRRLVRHRRKNWRKLNVDDVEEYLEDRRLEERTGGIRADQPDSALFSIDRAGVGKKELKGLGPVSRVGRPANSRLIQPRRKKQPSPPPGDLWKSVGKGRRRADQVLEADDLANAHNGVSYNPDKKLHETYLSELGRRESIDQMRRERQVRWAKRLKECRWKTFVEEMRQGLDRIEEADEDDEVEETVEKTIKKSGQVKSEKKKHNYKMAKVEARRRLRLKEEARRLAQFSNLKNIKREIEAEEKESLRRQMKRRNRKKKTKRLAPTKYNSPTRNDYKLREEIEENHSSLLRNLKPEGDLFHEKFKSFQKRNMIAPPSNVKKPKKKGRYKKVPRSIQRV